MRAYYLSLLAGLLAVLAFSCDAPTQGTDQKRSNHSAVGLWELESDSRVFLAIYPDHKATVGGRPLTWDPADDSSIRLQEKHGEREEVLHFRVISGGDVKAEIGELREGGGVAPYKFRRVQ